MRDGAVAACRAHNPMVGGSIPSPASGIETLTYGENAMLKDWIWMRVLTFLLTLFGLGVTGCASHVTIHKGTLGTPAHSLFKVWGTWNLTAECTPFEKLLNGLDALWKAKLPTPVIDAASIAAELEKIRGG